MTLFWDTMIVYAVQDQTLASDYAVRLELAGLAVRLDDQTSVKSAESLQRIIEVGLKQARTVIVILSPEFLKVCPPNDCDVLFQRETPQPKIILPVWHRLTRIDLGGWSPFSKTGFFSSEEHEVVVSGLLSAIRSLPAPADSTIRFLNYLHSDPVSVHTLVKSRLEEGNDDLQVLWPTQFTELLSDLEDIKLAAERHHDSRSPFYKQPPEQVTQFLESASLAIRNANTVKRNAPREITSLIEAMAKYWDGLPSLIERALTNFLTLANYEAQAQMAYCFRYISISERMPKIWLPWFEPDRTNLRRLAELFAIEGEMGRARVSTISDTYVNAYFWGPLPMLMEAAQSPIDKPITNPWFSKYLIPQAQLHRIGDEPGPTIEYREVALITKVRNERGDELY